MNDGRPLTGADHELTAVELLLGEGTESERMAFRARVGAEPALALEVADAAQFLEGCRSVGRELSGLGLVRLRQLERLAARRLERRRPVTPLWRKAVPLACAAAITLAALVAGDPLGLRGDALVQPVEMLVTAAPTAPAVSVPEPAVEPPPELLDGSDPLFGIRCMLVQELQRDPQSELGAALQRHDAGDPLHSWLQPHNVLAVLRLDYELRGSAEFRRRALFALGGLPAADDRVQTLANLIADSLPVRLGAEHAAAQQVGDVALAVRALLAAGPGRGRGDALLAAGAWLDRQLPRLHGGELAAALLALGEFSGSTGLSIASVGAHGQRLVDETVQVDAETWGRRRPELLARHTKAANLVDAGRFLLLAPGFGVDVHGASLVREMMLGHLLERRAAGGESADVLAAIAFGFGDLLPYSRRLEVEQRLRTWRVVALERDFVTLHHLAWSRRPDVPGFARLQFELRRVATAATPESMADRAALCLCLAASYAAPELAARRPLT